MQIRMVVVIIVLLLAFIFAGVCLGFRCQQIL